jgi:hypothetical protein
MRTLLNLVLLSITAHALAQLPETDLWIFKIETGKHKPATLTNPVNITNRIGYDNQPSFSNDGKKIFYVSVGTDNQADIYYFDTRKKKTVRLTSDNESEYSPVQTAQQDLVTCVVVENDSAQRIHYKDIVTGSDVKALPFDSVGYYTFMNKDTIIYYKLTTPHSLRYYTVSGEDRWLGNSPTRTFKAINRHTLIYGLKDSVKTTLYKYDFLLHKGVKFAQCPSLNEDMVWHRQYGVVISDRNRLLRFDASQNGWVTLFDLSQYGIERITRFAFDPKTKYLVVVDNR